MTSIKKKTAKIFQVFQLSEINEIEFSHRTIAISEDDLFCKKNGENITSFEKFNTPNLLSIYNYLRYRLYPLENCKTN